MPLRPPTPRLILCRQREPRTIAHRRACSLGEARAQTNDQPPHAPAALPAGARHRARARTGGTAEIHAHWHCPASPALPPVVSLRQARSRRPATRCIEWNYTSARSCCSARARSTMRCSCPARSSARFAGHGGGEASRCRASARHRARGPAAAAGCETNTGSGGGSRVGFVRSGCGHVAAACCGPRLRSCTYATRVFSGVNQCHGGNMHVAGSHAPTCGLARAAVPYPLARIRIYCGGFHGPW